MKRFLKITSIALLIFTAVNAAVAGVLFMMEPSGNKMGLNVSYLKDAPFRNYFIPGLILFVVNGLMNFMAAFYLFKKKSFAPTGVLVQGILLCGWIVIQVIMVNDISLLHVIMFLVGMILSVSGILLLKIKSNEAGS